MVNKHNVYKIGGIEYVREDNETESDGLCKACRDLRHRDAEPLDEPLEDDESSDVSAPVTNSPAPCKDSDSSTCPYQDMECSECESMSQEQRDTLEQMKDMRDEPSLEHITKIARSHRSSAA